MIEPSKRSKLHTTTTRPSPLESETPNSRSTERGTSTEPRASISLLRTDKSNLKIDCRNLATNPKSRPFPVVLLHTARLSSRVSPSSNQSRLCRGQIKDRGLRRVPETQSISLVRKNHHESKRKTEKKGKGSLRLREWSPATGGRRQSRVKLFFCRESFSLFFFYRKFRTEKLLLCF